MQFRKAILFTLGSTWGLWGCGTVPTDTPTSDSPESAAEKFQFADDAEPAVAALEFVDSQLLVQTFPGADPKTLTDLYQTLGAEVVDQMDEIDATVLEFAPDRLNEVALGLDASSLIESIQKNYIFRAQAIPNDTFFSSQNYLDQIGAPAAWDVTVGSEEIVIAIVDTGVDPEHPDLKEKILDGWNFYDDNSDYHDLVGHGTAVAGVAAAASNNQAGVAGVSWLSPILAVRVTDDEGKTTARHIAAGILWAAGVKARVINVSFAPLQYNRLIRSAAQSAFHQGSLVVISAGNDGEYADTPGYVEALFVGAINSFNTIASFSTRGPFVDVVAPGSAIRTTRLGGSYGLQSGTSFSAPIVSGAAALILAANPALRPSSIQASLLNTALDLGEPEVDDVYGYGGIVASAAVGQGVMTVQQDDTTIPLQWIQVPKAGESLSGIFVASVMATDESGIADVVFSIDDLPVATDTSSPYKFVTNTANYATGPHTLSFVATDLAGNASETDSVIVTFGTPSPGTSTGETETNPRTEILFESPANGTVVTGTLQAIKALIFDEDGLASVEWFVDGNFFTVSAVAGKSREVQFFWRPKDVDPGHHTIMLAVTDLTGARTTAALDLITK